MITLEHVKTLSPTELKILVYMDLTDKTLSITQEHLAKEINVNIRSIREALKVLEARGIISYKRSIVSSTKSVITIQ
jgi:transcription initiation factor IIE alpha subunit